MGRPKKDYTGVKIGNLEVLYYTSKGKWMCKCNCGKPNCVGNIEIRGWDIENKRRKNCSASKQKEDLTGMHINELEVLSKNADGTWLCKCSCGNIKSMADRGLRSRTTQTCGHNFSSYVDIANKTFGELTPLKYLGSGFWECKCSCGAMVNARGIDIRSGNTRSCGHTQGNKNLIDLSGLVINSWKVLNYSGDSYWKCKCSCGTIKDVHSYSLRNGLSECCGSAVHRYIDLKGKVFGELTVEKYLGNGTWECKCSCGNTKSILGVNLRNGSTHSCGCKSIELLRNTLMDRYGETCPSKVDNPRDMTQILILNDKEAFNRLIKLYSIKYRTKPHIYNIAELLGVDKNTIKIYANRYGLLDEFNSSSGSSYENEIVEIFGDNNIIRHDRKGLKSGKEIDIYFPDKKLGIEFNGNYWHSIAHKDKKYHQDKSLDAIDSDIRLIHVFEYEWNNLVVRNKIIELINFELNKLETNVIYGRTCKVKEILSTESFSFLEEYHLQGSAPALVNLGLYRDDELLGIMTFGKPRFNTNYEWELIRLCWKPGNRVVGGTKKLFSYFIDKYNPENIISYCDISKFSGKVYEQLGFKCDGVTEPNYVWVDRYTNDIKSRYQTMKHKLVEQGLGTEVQTEDEIMENLGYLKIYDCGNIRYIWNKLNCK